MKNFLLLFLLSSLVTGQSVRQTSGEPGRLISTFSCDFERHYQVNAAEVDTIAGKLWFWNQDQLYLEVQYPVRQIMFFDGRETSIYYPIENRAFLLISEYPAMLPIVPGLLSVFQYQNGMEELGFALHKQKIKADTLVTRWQHPDFPQSNTIYQLSEVADQLVRSYFADRQEQWWQETRFIDYQIVGSMMLPTRIAAQNSHKETISTEILLLQNLTLNSTIPSEVQAFKIPQGVPVERRRW